MRQGKLFCLLALSAVLAVGCTVETSTTTSNGSGSATTAAGGQSDQALADANLTLVSFKVPGMT